MLLAPVPSINNTVPVITYAAPAPEPLTISAAKPLPTPIGQTSFALRLGIAESDTLSYFGGLSYEIPIQVVVHIVSIRVDGDIWEHTSGNNGGGVSGGVNAIFGPNSSYVGAGINYSARLSHASGPEGPGIKLLFGGQPLPVIGYEVDAIIANKGAVGAAMLTFHF